MLAGHYLIKCHLHKLGLAVDNICRHCNEEKEIQNTLNVNAQLYTAKDKKSSGQPNETKGLDIVKLVEYIKSIVTLKQKFSKETQANAAVLYVETLVHERSAENTSGCFNNSLLSQPLQILDQIITDDSSVKCYIYLIQAIYCPKHCTRIKMLWHKNTFRILKLNLNQFNQCHCFREEFTG